MKINHELDIIIPVYYEEENVTKVLSSIKKNVKTKHKVFIVYDSKKDPTVNVVKKYIKQNKNIFLLQNSEGNKRGVVNALKTGFKKTKGPIVCITMADLSDNPKDIDKMVKKIHLGADLVSASRYSRGGSLHGGPPVKKILSKYGSKILNLITSLPTRDSTNAFKCFKRKVVKTIDIESTGGFEIALELTVKSYLKGYKIVEIPTVWKDRTKGESKFDLAKWFPKYLKWFFYAIEKKYIRQ